MSDWLAGVKKPPPPAPPAKPRRGAELGERARLVKKLKSLHERGGEKLYGGAK